MPWAVGQAKPGRILAMAAQVMPLAAVPSVPSMGQVSAASHVADQPGDRLPGRDHHGMVGRRQAAVADGEDHDGRVRLQLPGESIRALLEQGDLGGGSRARQVGRRPVDGHVRQAARQPVQQDDGKDPGQHHRPA